MFHISYSIIPVFLLIFIGYVAKQFKSIDQAFWAGCSKLVYYLFFPALLINAIVTTNFKQDIHLAIIPLIIVTVVYAAVLILLQTIFKLDGKAFSSVFQGIVRYNSYIFIGVSVALLGPQSLPIVAIVITYMIIVTNVLSVVVLSIYAAHEKINIKKIIINLIKNPLILACIFATAWNELHFDYPSIVHTTFNYIGGAALPVSLMCVGAGLRFEHLYKNLPLVILVDLIKLLTYPIAVYIALNLFHCHGMARHVVMVYAVVPCAGNAYILAKQMNGDHELMSTLLCTMVLGSVITIPIMLHFL